MKHTATAYLTAISEDATALHSRQDSAVHDGHIRKRRGRFQEAVDDPVTKSRCLLYQHRNILAEKRPFDSRAGVGFRTETHAVPHTLWGMARNTEKRRGGAVAFERGAFLFEFGKLLRDRALPRRSRFSLIHRFRNLKAYTQRWHQESFQAPDVLGFLE